MHGEELGREGGVRRERYRGQVGVRGGLRERGLWGGVGGLQKCWDGGGELGRDWDTGRALQRKLWMNEYGEGPWGVAEHGEW